LFHPQSLPLQAEISELESAYRELTRRIEQMPGDATSHWMQQRTELNEMMLRMLKVRRELAHISGLPNFLAFRWRELNRLDFSIEECQAFHRTVEEFVVPVLVQFQANDQPDSSYPEIADPTALSAGVERILHNLDPAFGALFAAMRSGYLDFGRRPGKAITSEQWFFPRAGMPYLHVASTNLATVLHESGHAAHAYLSFQAHPSMWNFAGPDEFQEFVAEAMGILCWPYYEQAQGGFYSAAESAAARRQTLLLRPFASDVMEDAFEHWVYGEAPDDVTPAELDAKWLEYMKRFTPWRVAEMDEEEAMTGWQRWNWSLFRMPLYTFSYAVATVGFCLFGRQLQLDRASAIDNYKAALSLGNTESLPELFRVAGLSFPFTHQAVAEAVQFALDEYKKVGI
jgi:oligoendopeptidase F